MPKDPLEGSNSSIDCMLQLPEVVAASTTTTHHLWPAMCDTVLLFSACGQCLQAAAAASRQGSSACATPTFSYLAYAFLSFMIYCKNKVAVLIACAAFSSYLSTAPTTCVHVCVCCAFHHALSLECCNCSAFVFTTFSLAKPQAFTM